MEKTKKNFDFSRKKSGLRQQAKPKGKTIYNVFYIKAAFMAIQSKFQ